MAGEHAPSRRRWFQFSLTSLLLLTTLVALWLAWELAFIRERQAWLRDNAVLVGPDAATNQLTSAAGGAAISFVQVVPPPPTIPRSIRWWRRLLGDEAVPTIAEGENWDDDDRALVARLFPEATVLPRLSITTSTVTLSIDASTELQDEQPPPENGQPGEQDSDNAAAKSNDQSQP